MLNSDLNSNRDRRAFEGLNCGIKLCPAALCWNIVFFIIIIFAFFPRQSLSATDAYHYPIQRIEVRGLTSITEENLLELLNIHVGKTLDGSAVKAGIKRVFLTGLVTDIVVETEDGHPGLIRITVKEKEIIDSIGIKGNDHFAGKFIKKHLAVSIGERLSHAKIRRGISALIHEMAIRGFADAQVTYSIGPRVKGRVALLIDVVEGSPLIIKKIVITGPEDVIRSRLSISVGDIYDRSQMEKAAKTVTGYYRKLGHIGPSLTYNFKEGVLSILLTQGKILKVSFTGNNAFQSKELIKEVPFFEINEFSDDLLEETVLRIESLYHRNGFPFVQAAPLQTLADNSVDVEFFIFEGEKYRVKDVHFEGATISPATLRSILALRAVDLYNPDLIEPGLDTLTEFYHALGYINVEIHKPELKFDDNRAEIFYLIKEGPQVKIRSVSVKGNREIGDSEILKEALLKTGQPYNELDIADATRKIREMYNKRGFITVRVTVERSIVDASADISFTIQEGGITRFGKTIVVGNERTRQSLIEREFLHREGLPFDYSLLLKEKQELFRLGLFSDIEVTPTERSDTNRDIIYKLKEANAGTVEFGFGYGEFERYRGFLDVGYKNLWGMNRQISFRTELSSLEQRYILSYNQPWFIVKELAFRALLLHENRKVMNLDNNDIQYHLKRDTASVGIEKKILGNLKAELYYDFSVVRTFDVLPDIVLSREDTGTLIISGIRPGLLYDTRDNPFEPRKGILAGLSFKLASSLFFSQTDFGKLTIYANKYYGLHKRVVLALSARAGAANGFGATRELPIVERFFLGGRTTVRGYSQDTLGPKGTDGNPTGGNAFAMGNVELRTDVGRGFGVVTFLDGGNVWRKIADASIADFKYTTGLGLRYTTPVGPFRVDYGIKLNKDTGESRGEIHFSLGHAF